MSDRISVERPFHVKRRAKGQRRMVRGDTPVDKAVPGRIPRVAKLMALAIRFEGMIRDGVVKDQAELARLGRVSRARLTQIMGLLSLAPDIQEAILWLPAVESGREAVTERDLRQIAREVDWRRQRRRWAALGMARAVDAIGPR